MKTEYKEEKSPLEPEELASDSVPVLDFTPESEEENDWEEKVKKEIKLSDYEHFVDSVFPDHEFFDRHTLVCVKTKEHLLEILELEKESKNCAFDLETNSLNPEIPDAMIVGVALCMNKTRAYYVPINHENGLGLGNSELKTIYDFLLTRKVITFNVRFDFRWMEFQGFDMSPIALKRHSYDIQTGIFLSDTNIRMPSLKKSENRFLGVFRPNYLQTLGDNPNLYFVEPEAATPYAATDALTTFKMAPIALQFTREAGFSGELDNEFLYPLMKCEEEKNWMDVHYLLGFSQEVEEALVENMRQIYELAGEPFNIGSTKQKSDILTKLKVKLPKSEKTGNLKTGKDLLAKVQHKHPIIPLLLEHSELRQAKNSYLKPILKACGLADSKGDLKEGEDLEKPRGLRFAYQTCVAPTCRLSAGADGKNTFFTPMNIQSVKKSKTHIWSFRKLEEGDEPKENSEVILGYEFNPDATLYDTRCEGTNPKANIRRAFRASVDDSQYVVSIDYSGQELRVMALLSQEPAWVEAFKKGEDLHKAMAIQMWGIENYTKDLRKKAKPLNFGLGYGMSIKTLASRENLTMEEAEHQHKSWWKAVPKIKSWGRQMVRDSKSGTLYNMFGRPRRMKWYWQQKEGSIRAFAQRTALNQPIQSVGADILKYSLTKIFVKYLNNPEYKKDVRFLSTVHDEINFGVNVQRAYELIPTLLKEMTIKLEDWPFAIDCGLTVGFSWGLGFEFKITEEGEFIPSSL